MFTSLAVVSLLSTAVFAQSSSSLIPSDISDSCNTFLSSLDSNTTIASCISPMLEATQAFAPGSSSSTPSASNLATICAATTCPDTTLRSILTSFAGACSDEITSDSSVITLYDIIYLLSPMTTALCSKSDSGSYCALSATTTSSSSSAAASVVAAAADTQKYISNDGTLNSTTFTTDNVPFMFLQSGLASSQCTACTRNIMTSYINWESNCPYAPSLANTVLLNGQTKLYNAITGVCGTSFLSGVVQAAGGLGTGSKNGSPKSAGFDIQTVAVAVVSMLMASMF